MSAARPFRLRAVLFDFDGTLTHPGALDFAAIKREVGCPPDQFVLEWILALPAGETRDAAALALERFELAAADASAPNEGAEELVRWLRRSGLAVGVLTRNGLRAVERALRRFTALTVDDFDVVVTRDDGHLAPKPAPDGVLHAAAAMGVAPEETLVVGDFLLDMRAGRAAGAVTAYLVNHGAPGDGEAAEPQAADCDFVVGRLPELEDVVRFGLPLPPGKLPNDLLAGFLAGVAGDDPTLVVAPGVGEDVAAVDLGGAELLVVHGDPITLGGEDVGRAAVLVNVNDIAAAGAEPRWLLATVLLPPGTTPSQALAQLQALADAAAGAGVTLAGGHTEVTDAVTRPVVSLTALGTLGRAETQGQALGARGRSRAAHQGAGDGGRGAARRRARRASPRPRHERGRSWTPAAPCRSGRASSRRRASPAASPACGRCTTSPRAGSPRRCASWPRRPAAASSCTWTASPSRRRRGACATCSAPTRWGSSPPAACSCAAIRRRPPACSPRSSRPASRRPTSASSPQRAPGSPRWSAAGRRPGRTSRPTRPRGCWQGARRIRKQADARPGRRATLQLPNPRGAGSRAALRGP